jgi:hypothetical protein
MQIRYIPKEIFDIQTEILIFDNTVAMYRIEPEIYYMEIEDKNYAKMMRDFFDNLWNASQAMIWGVGGSALAKQYVPYSKVFSGIPTVIYPAKDDGNILQAFPDELSIMNYLEKVLSSQKIRIQ